MLFCDCRDKLNKFVKENLPSMVKDFSKGKIKMVMHRHSDDITVASFTTRLSSDVLYKHWFWIVGEEVFLVNSTIKFKHYKSQPGFNPSVKNTKYESVGGDFLGKKQLEGLSVRGKIKPSKEIIDFIMSFDRKAWKPEKKKLAA